MTDAFLHGCHLSIAGGVERALEEAQRLEINALQIFTRAPSAWRAPRIAEETAAAFRERRAGSTVAYLVVHTAYLLNLASPEEALFERSVAALLEELRRAALLGADALVTHLGAHRGTGVRAGIERIASALRTVLAARLPRDASPPTLLLENSAGAGTTLGARFEQIGAILDRVPSDGRLGVCLDSCHAFAAGYDLRGPDAVEETLAALAETIGLARLRLLHLNDAKHDLGSRRDRHEHIGRGRIGTEGFAALLNDPRLRPLPYLLETPKSFADGTEADPANLRMLRRLRVTDGNRS
jgi:deoxyribonuclease-4